MKLLLNLLLVYLKLRKPVMSNFGEWAKLESIAVDVGKAVDTNVVQFSELTLLYISTALHIPLWVFNRVSWSNTLSLYFLAVSINSPSKIPLLTTFSNKKKDRPVSWDYEERNYIYWSHLLASEYGWTLDYIFNLDTNVALAHIQEILTDQQLNREFTWSTTEIAYPYNSTTKESKFKPLERPYWMLEKAQPIKKIRILKAHWPSGIIQNVSGIKSDDIT